MEKKESIVYVIENHKTWQRENIALGIIGLPKMLIEIWHITSFLKNVLFCFWVTGRMDVRMKNDNIKTTHVWMCY